MQFIDQAPAYRAKALTLNAAIDAGRARLTGSPGAQKIVACFRPELEIATAFDQAIHERVRFNDLPTPEKLDLMIAELLPGFYHPEDLGLTGRSTWTVRFLVDGTVERILRMDEEGLRAIDGTAATPDVELETDIMTLMAILRSVIADYHRATKTYAAPGRVAAIPPDDPN